MCLTDLADWHYLHTEGVLVLVSVVMYVVGDELLGGLASGREGGRREGRGRKEGRAGGGRGGRKEGGEGKERGGNRGRVVELG